MNANLARIIVGVTKNLRHGQRTDMKSPQFGAFWITRLPDGVLQVEERPNEIVAPGRHWGNVLWDEMHRGALTLSAPQERAALVESVTKRLPCGDCKAHWRELLAKMPPLLDDSDSFFNWTVAVHNRVNERLGAAIMTREDARKKWGS